jgi:hypothetical protein
MASVESWGRSLARTTDYRFLSSENVRIASARSEKVVPHKESRMKTRALSWLGACLL